jgi:uncharacterized protein YjiS (DUF1127 family)
MRQIFPDTGTATLWSAVAAATVPLPRRGFGAAPRVRLGSRRAASWPGQVRATLWLWQDRVRGRQQLLRLDDHVLRDIGITRLQADAEANKPFWCA